MSKKYSHINYNGKQIYIADFRYIDGMAYGSVNGHDVKVKARLDRGERKYGTAKRAIIDEVYRLYGTEKGETFGKQPCKKPAIIDGHKVETTRTKRLANGVAKVTGFVDGVFVETFFKGESTNMGRKFDGKPYLYDEREALVREFLEQQNPRETEIPKRPKTAPIDDFFKHELKKSGVVFDDERNTAEYCDVEFSLDGMEQIDVVRKLGKIYNEYVEKCAREVNEFLKNFGS